MAWPFERKRRLKRNLGRSWDAFPPFHLDRCDLLDWYRTQVARLEEKLTEAQEEVERQRRRCKNTALAWAHAGEMQDTAVQLRAEWDAAIERAERAEALAERLMEAGVTDYSKPPWGLNRVECHFCPGVWRADEPAKHKTPCPLAEAQEHPQGGQKEGE